MKKFKTLIHLTSENSIDQLSPLIWHLLNNNHYVKIFFLKKYNYNNDDRINYFQSYKNFKIISDEIYYENKFNLFIIKFLNYLVKKTKIFLNNESIFFKLILKLLKLFSKLDELDLDFIFFQWGEFSHHIIPAKSFGIKVIALPHGFNIYLNQNTNLQLEKILTQDKVLNEIYFYHNLYDYYIVENEINKKNAIKFGIKDKIVKNWGSPRYSKKWIYFYYKLIEKKNVNHDKNKILFLLPHWSFKVNIDETFELIRHCLNKFPGGVTIKPHIRKKFTDYDLKAKKLIDDLKATYSINIAENESTPNLIQKNEIIVGFGTSVIIDALYLNKILIIPDYLQKNDTIFNNSKLSNLVYSSEEFSNILNNLGNIKVKHQNFQLMEKKYIRQLNKDIDILENYEEQLNLLLQSSIAKGKSI